MVTSYFSQFDTLGGPGNWIALLCGYPMMYLRVINRDGTVSWSVTDPEPGVAASAGCGTQTISVQTADAGTLNDALGYRLEIVVTDGPDRFQIRIWDRARTLVYGTAPLAGLVEGSVEIRHQVESPQAGDTRALAAPGALAQIIRRNASSCCFQNPSP